MRKREIVVVSVLCVLLMVVFAAAIFVGAADAGGSDGTTEPGGTREPARSLDIVSYDPPKWGGDRVSECWYLVDRLSNHRFWLLKIDGQWVPLDIGEVENLG